MEPLEEKIVQLIRSLPIFKEGDFLNVKSFNSQISGTRVISVYYFSQEDMEYNPTDLNIKVPEEMLERVTGFRLFWSLESGIVSGYIKVHPQHRGRGKGTLMAQAMEDISRLLGLKEIKLEEPNKEFFKPERDYKIGSDGYAYKQIK